MDSSASFGIRLVEGRRVPSQFVQVFLVVVFLLLFVYFCARQFHSGRGG